MSGHARCTSSAPLLRQWRVSIFSHRPARWSRFPEELNDEAPYVCDRVGAGAAARGPGRRAHGRVAHHLGVDDRVQRREARTGRCDQRYRRPRLFRGQRRLPGPAEQRHQYSTAAQNAAIDARSDAGAVDAAAEVNDAVFADTAYVNVTKHSHVVSLNLIEAPPSISPPARSSPAERRDQQQHRPGRSDRRDLRSPRHRHRRPAQHRRARQQRAEQPGDPHPGVRRSLASPHRRHRGADAHRVRLTRFSLDVPGTTAKYRKIGICSSIRTARRQSTLGGSRRCRPAACSPSSLSRSASHSSPAAGRLPRRRRRRRPRHGRLSDSGGYLIEREKSDLRALYYLRKDLELVKGVTLQPGRHKLTKAEARQQLRGEMATWASVAGPEK
jgi:hypothetical protein